MKLLNHIFNVINVLDQEVCMIPSHYCFALKDYEFPPSRSKAEAVDHFSRRRGFGLRRCGQVVCHFSSTVMTSLFTVPSRFWRPHPQLTKAKKII